MERGVVTFCLSVAFHISHHGVMVIGELCSCESSIDCLKHLETTQDCRCMIETMCISSLSMKWIRTSAFSTFLPFLKKKEMYDRNSLDALSCIWMAAHR
jgi:hypothetical protein